MERSNPQKRRLEITVLSAEGLITKWASNNLYVVVRAESIKTYTTGFASSQSPSWNHKLLVDLPLNSRSITFEVKCKTTSSSASAKDVGVARIAVSDFLGGVVPDHCVRFLSYRLRDWEGRRNGVLNFSVRVKSPFPAKANCCGIQMRLPLEEATPTFSASGSGSGGVVTGVPIMWNNNYATTTNV